MKTLENHTLIIDSECPLCRAYSAGFVKTGMLDPNGRLPYHSVSGQMAQWMDLNRSRNEIALVDTRSGYVYYGIESLFTILQHSFPVFRPLFQARWFRFLMAKLYSFISYNRKVIMPGKPEKDVCVPSFSLPYRLTWLLFTWLITSLILTRYASSLQPLLPETRFFREFLICGGQILFQTLVLYWIKKDKLYDYLGNMMTISFAGSLALLLCLGLGRWLEITHPLVYAGMFGLVVGGMFLEHLRRMPLLSLNAIPSLTWVLYRCLILLLLF